MRDGRRKYVVRENRTVSPGRDLPHNMRDPSAVLIVRAPIPRAKIPKHRFVAESVRGAVDHAVVKAERGTKYLDAVVERASDLCSAIRLLSNAEPRLFVAEPLKLTVSRQPRTAYRRHCIMSLLYSKIKRLVYPTMSCLKKRRRTEVSAS